MDTILQLGIALAIGFLIGMERGWQEREAEEGQRLAGIRTFGLIGLLGGTWALISQEMGVLLQGFAFLALASFLMLGYYLDVRKDHDIGLTTVMAAMLTFTFGALCVIGHATVAAAAAVVTTTILTLKPTLHQWLQKMERVELHAVLKFLLISVVILPVLPNQGYGPWQTLNPYQIWWMVVLIAGISSVGYFAIKLAGAEKGISLTALFGGIASSTATTINLAHFRNKMDIPFLLSAGVLLSAATMFPRVLIEVAVVNWSLLPLVAIPLVSMTLVTLLLAVWAWWRNPVTDEHHELELENPFQIMTALKFGALLALIMLLAKGLQAWLGDQGIYLLSLASGLADVDAITLSLAKMAREGLAAQVAADGIVIASIVNTAVKGVLFAAIAGIKNSRWLVIAIFSVSTVGTIALLLSQS
ncbi:MAG: MgtC/SapB family protein [Pseudomonadales bacterium]